MGQHFNPQNLLAASLEVDRINQISQLSPGEKQAILFQERNKKRRLEQSRVESKEETSGLMVDEQTDDNQKKSQTNRNLPDDNKGNNLDIKI